jgi:small GTP-binding protein
MVQKKICMLGYYGVGKTSLVSQFVSSIFSEKYLTTVSVKIDKKVLDVDGRPVTLMLWDLAGEEDDAPLKLSMLRGASGYLLVIDGLRSKTLSAAVGIQERLEAAIGRLPFLLLVNKADQRANWEVLDADLSDLRQRGWTVLATSAKSGENVEEAFLQLAAEMLKDGESD